VVLPYSLIGGDRTLPGSMIGDIAKAREMLDFCAARRIEADGETIPIDYVNEAWHRIERSDVRYRFVIDMASLEP
jgi:D-arabinose 1-dehydrogenase-like Zn-dependent alcohol dehydrogenase